MRCPHYLFSSLLLAPVGLLRVVLARSSGNTFPTTAAGITRLHGGCSEASTNPNQKPCTVIGEKVVYDGWRKVVRKEVVMPNAKSVLFDVVTTNGMPAVAVFVWDKESCTATVLQEYHPGPEKMMHGVVAGCFESHKHSSPLECAAAELEEEAHLKTSTLIPLLQDGETTVPFEKYSDNRFYPYLALDCEPVANPKPLDDEEYIIIHKNVSYKRLMEMIAAGQFNVISSYTILMAIRKLTEMGLPLEK
jgi:NUDIX domain